MVEAGLGVSIVPLMPGGLGDARAAGRRRAAWASRSGRSTPASSSAGASGCPPRVKRSSNSCCRPRQSAAPQPLVILRRVEVAEDVRVVDRQFQRFRRVLPQVDVQPVLRRQRPDPRDVLPAISVGWPRRPSWVGTMIEPAGAHRWAASRPRTISGRSVGWSAGTSSQASSGRGMVASSSQLQARLHGGPHVGRFLGEQQDVGARPLRPAAPAPGRAGRRRRGRVRRRRRGAPRSPVPGPCGRRAAGPAWPAHADALAGGGDQGEGHGRAFPTGTWMRAAAMVAPRLRQAISSATMLTAISGTVCEPMAKPSGAWTRASASAGMPLAIRSS